MKIKISWVRDIMGAGLEYVAGKPGEPGLHYRRDLAAGAAELVESKGGKPYLNYVCPCGCGVVGSLPLAPIRTMGETGWDWEMADDMRVAPVLRPSIRRTFGCKWHGYLGGEPRARDPGIWVACGDWLAANR